MLNWLRRRPIPRVSIVICSIDRAKFERVTDNYSNLFKGIEIEVIGIHNAKSLAEGYNRALQRVRGEYVIFSHDDIRILTPDFADRFFAHFDRFDMFGVAGTKKVVGGAWFLAGDPYDYMLVTSPFKEPHQLVIVAQGGGDLVIDQIQALDGLFIASRSCVAKAVRFDAGTFDHFHLYDLDFSYRAFLIGYKLGVCRDLFVIHDSHGRFDEVWKLYKGRFESKFANTLAGGHHKKPSLVKNILLDVNTFNNKTDVVELCRPDTLRNFIPQQRG